MIDTNYQRAISEIPDYEETALQLFLPVESHVPAYWRDRDIQVYGKVSDRNLSDPEDHLSFIEEVADSVLYRDDISFEDRWSFYLGVEAFFRYHGGTHTCSSALPMLSTPTRPLDWEHAYAIIRRYECLDINDIENETIEALHYLVIETLEILCSTDLSLKDRATLVEGIEKILDEKILDWSLDLTPFFSLTFGAQTERNFPKHFYYDEAISDTPCFHYMHSILNEEDEGEVYHVYTPIEKFDNYCYEIESVKIGDYDDADSVTAYDLDHLEAEARKTKKKCQELSLSLFPAIEASPSFWAHLFCDISKEYPYSSEKERRIGELGYSFEIDLRTNQSFFTIPSVELLQLRIEQFLERQGLIVDVPILRDPGILTDQSFVEAYLDYHIVVSTGREALHDHYAHVLPTVGLMIELKEVYFREKERIVECVRRQKEKIERDIAIHSIPPHDAELLWLGLSSVVDRVWNAKSLKDLEKVQDQYLVNGSWVVFIDRHNDNRYQTYRSRRFPEEADILHLRYQAIIDRYRLIGYDKITLPS